MKTEKSCGAVLFTRINGMRYYVLVSAADENNCGLPKGHVENDETEEETALREIHEETCVSAVIIGDFRREIVYKMANGNSKQVVYFIAQYENQIAQKNPAEKNNVLLLPFTEALQAITHTAVKEILKEADAWLMANQ